MGEGENSVCFVFLKALREVWQNDIIIFRHDGCSIIRRSIQYTIAGLLSIIIILLLFYKPVAVLLNQLLALHSY